MHRSHNSCRNASHLRWDQIRCKRTLQHPRLTAGLSFFVSLVLGISCPFWVIPPPRWNFTSTTITHHQDEPSRLHQLHVILHWITGRLKTTKPWKWRRPPSKLFFHPPSARIIPRSNSNLRPALSYGDFCVDLLHPVESVGNSGVSSEIKKKKKIAANKTITNLLITFCCRIKGIIDVYRSIELFYPASSFD